MGTNAVREQTKHPGTGNTPTTVCGTEEVSNHPDEIRKLLFMDHFPFSDSLDPTALNFLN